LRTEPVFLREAVQKALIAFRKGLMSSSAFIGLVSEDQKGTDTCLGNLHMDIVFRFNHTAVGISPYPWPY
jgi:hypothetical protein